MLAAITDGFIESVKNEAQELMGQNYNPGAIEKIMKELPEKALGIGIRVLLALLFFLIGLQIIKLVRKIVKKSMTKGKVDIGVIQFTDSFLNAALFILLVFLIATSLGVDAASVVAIIGSAGVAIGLALQGSLSNLAGGVLILILKPFKVGDYIVDAAGREGSVTEIQMFYTKLCTPDNKVIILPNGALANGSITNVSVGEFRRCDINVGISYDADIKLARKTIMQVLADDDNVEKGKEMQVLVDELGESSVNLIVRCWFHGNHYWPGRFRLTEEIKLALDEAGVQIPYPQVDVHMVSGK